MAMAQTRSQAKTLSKAKPISSTLLSAGFQQFAPSPPDYRHWYGPLPPMTGASIARVANIPGVSTTKEYSSCRRSLRVVESRDGLSNTVKGDVRAISNATSAFEAGLLFFNSISTSKPESCYSFSLLRKLSFQGSVPSRLSMALISQQMLRPSATSSHYPAPSNTPYH